MLEERAFASANRIESCVRGGEHAAPLLTLEPSTVRKMTQSRKPFLFPSWRLVWGESALLRLHVPVQEGGRPYYWEWGCLVTEH